MDELKPMRELFADEYLDNLPEVLYKCGEGSSLAKIVLANIDATGDPVGPESCRVCAEPACLCIEVVYG